MNIANVLTFLRIGMIPLAGYMFYISQFDIAAAVFLLACLTDVLDGFLARRLNLITDMGKLLDPLADKGMQLTVLISLAFCGRMPFVAVIIILLKEVLMFFGYNDFGDFLCVEVSAGGPELLAEGFFRFDTGLCTH